MNVIEVAEIVGRHIADGYLVKSPNRNGYRIVLTEALPILRDQLKLIRRNFDVKSSRIKARNNIYDLIVYSKSLYRFLRETVGIPQSKRSSKTLITKWMKMLNAEARKSMTRGVIDCDGTLYYDRINQLWIIELNIIHRDVITFVGEVLSRSSIRFITFKRVKKPPRRTSYALKILGRRNIAHYLKVIGSKKFKPRFAAGSRGAPG